MEKERSARVREHAIEARVLEVVDELPHEERDREHGDDRANAVVDAVDEIGLSSQRARDPAVRHAGQEEDEENERHDDLRPAIAGALARRGRSGCERRLTHARERPTRNEYRGREESKHEERNDTRHRETALFIGFQRELGERRHVVEFRCSTEPLEPRLDDPVGHEPAGEHDDDAAQRLKVQIVRWVDRVVTRVDDVRRRCRDAREKAVARIREEAAAEAARNTRERGREACDRRTIHGEVERRRERRQNDVARVRGDGSVRTDQNNRWGEEFARRDER